MLNAKEFNELAQLVKENCGIHLPSSKKTLLESRLNKRLRELNLNSFSAYIQYLKSPQGSKDELVLMIDEVTTNKTDFFREAQHFDYLTHQILPTYLEQNKNETFKIWSMPCSTGEEAYSMAITLKEFQLQWPLFNFRVLGSDVSIKVLETAKKAIYNIDRIQGIGLDIKKKYFLKSIAEHNPTVRLVPEIRNLVQFTFQNLMDENIQTDGLMDVIFCRNVLIYFDKPTQEKVVRKLIGKIKPGGYFFIGHSESLFQFDLPVKQVQPTIFIKL